MKRIPFNLRPSSSHCQASKPVTTVGTAVSSAPQKLQYAANARSLRRVQVAMKSSATPAINSAIGDAAGEDLRALSDLLGK